MNRTGMFLPPLIERVFKGDRKPQGLSFGKACVIFLALVAVIVGGRFIARAYTVHHLPLEQIDRVDVMTIAKEDLTAATQLLPSVLQDAAVASKLKSIEKSEGHRLLAYFIPMDYVMQGMIANTGGEWKLFEQHKTIGMITEYIFSPIRSFDRRTYVSLRNAGSQSGYAQWPGDEAEDHLYRNHSQEREA